MEKFTPTHSNIDSLDVICLQILEHTKYAQSSDFFHLTYRKNQRFSALRSKFSRRKVLKLYVGASVFGNIDINRNNIDTYFLPTDLFDDGSANVREYMQGKLVGSLVILCNNELGSPERRSNFAHFYDECKDTVFMIWDWDNHHNLAISLFLAIYSDIYFPAHNENLYILSRVNPMLSRIPCGIMQWDDAKLRSHFLDLTPAKRHAEPLGMHVYFDQFNFRNQAVVTLQQRYKSIGFADKTYLNRSSDDRLNEWCSFKSHWIIPVLNDVPIRLFDALVTGGIPIVPNSLRFMSPVIEIPSHDIVYYGPDDILNPQEVVTRANALFDSGGLDGVITRHLWAVDNHHINSRVTRMLHDSQVLLDFNFI